ncbi:FRG domain-containing protein [Candidatus Poribacteria bacterium]|nr:FRG domain-containing protein [Candidatus Poribacteria bacterium]
MMRPISNQIWCHLSVEDKRPHTNKEVKESESLEVSTYKDLVKYIAYISFKNPRFSLFFRGQNQDYKDKENASSLYSSIFRPDSGKDLKSKTLSKRVEALGVAEEWVQRYLVQDAAFRFEGASKLRKFREVRWALLQHYEVVPTPLLDVTQSLRVACSFALMNASKHGYVYVLGFPHINGSISYSVEEQMLNVKLLSICPPTALRPYFQEGYLVGDFPSSVEKDSQFNFARRLIAKFKLCKSTFWDDYFKEIPKEALFPNEEDEVKKICDEIKERLPTK